MPKVLELTFGFLLDKFPFFYVAKVTPQFYQPNLTLPFRPPPRNELPTALISLKHQIGAYCEGFYPKIPEYLAVRYKPRLHYTIC